MSYRTLKGITIVKLREGYRAVFVDCFRDIVESAEYTVYHFVEVKCKSIPSVNLLGAEQHGHMEAVGYDLYCKMLNEAVKEEKGELPPSVTLPCVFSVVQSA